MKKLGLVLVIVLMLGGVAVADTVTIDTYPGWNVIALPLVPFDPSTQSMFKDFDMMFTASLLRFDAPTQTQLALNPWVAPDPDFGNMLLGDGYTFYNPDAGQITYDGVPDGVPGTEINPATGKPFMTDMWISLPGDQNDGKNAGGWHKIGTPFNHDVAIDPNFALNGEGILFTDGTTVKTWSEAADNLDANGNPDPWVESSALYFDGATQAQLSTGYFFNDDDQFRAGKGYSIRTWKDNLAMIMPAN